EAVFLRVMAEEYPAPDLYNGLAAVYFAEGKQDQAQNILEQAVRLHVADGETYYNLAEFNFDHGNRPQADAYYNISIQLRYLPAFYRKARFEDVTGSTGEALRLLDQAKRLDSSSGDAEFEAGMIFYGQNQFAQAALEFQEAFRKNPSRTQLLYNLGLSEFRGGDKNSAKQHMQQFLQAHLPGMEQERQVAMKI